MSSKPAKKQPARPQSANRPKAEKRKAPSTAWKPGQSGNPKGAPKRGESWKEIIKAISDMTANEIAAWLKTTELADSFKKMPKGVTLKNLVVARVFAALMFEPQASLLTAFMDRAEGKVTEKYEVTIYDSIARKLNISPDEAKALAEQVASGAATQEDVNRIARGEITIEDLMTGKVKKEVKAGDDNDG